jgi:hypothetical protein
MKPQEKAKELVNKYLVNVTNEPIMTKPAINCALLLVNEMINEYQHFICEIGYDNDWDYFDGRKGYWEKVKQHLEQM